MRSVARGAAALTLAGTVLFAGACGGGNRPGTGAGSGPGVGAGHSGDYAVTVQFAGREVWFDASRLAGLPSATVQTPDSAGATTQSGPRLDTVLNAAGVGAYRSVRVLGLSESVSLARSEVTPELLLARTHRGTVKLAGPDLSPSRWVRDVTDIRVTR